MNHDGHDALDEIANGFGTGEGRLWAAVILTAWRDRRWRYFTDPGSTFPLAAACCGLDVRAARERARDRRPKKKA